MDECINILYTNIVRNFAHPVLEIDGDEEFAILANKLIAGEIVNMCREDLDDLEEMGIPYYIITTHIGEYPSDFTYDIQLDMGELEWEEWV